MSNSFGLQNVSRFDIGLYSLYAFCFSRLLRLMRLAFKISTRHRINCTSHLVLNFVSQWHIFYLFSTGVGVVRGVGRQVAAAVEQGETSLSRVCHVAACS